MLHEDFAKTAAAMHPLLHRALVEDIVDEEDAALVALLKCEKLVRTRCLLRRKAAMPPLACAALRDLVDAERDVTRDSVDHHAQHQLNINVDRLTECIGRDSVRNLWHLADELLDAQRAEATARETLTGEATPEDTATKLEPAESGYYVDLFV